MRTANVNTACTLTTLPRLVSHHVHRKKTQQVMTLAYKRNCACTLQHCRGDRREASIRVGSANVCYFSAGGVHVPQMFVHVIHEPDNFSPHFCSSRARAGEMLCNAPSKPDTRRYDVPLITEIRQVAAAGSKIQNCRKTLQASFGNAKNTRASPRSGLSPGQGKCALNDIPVTRTLRMWPPRNLRKALQQPNSNHVCQ